MSAQSDSCCSPDVAVSPDVTVVIPTWSASGFLRPCLSALERQTFLGFEVLVVDNGATAGKGERLDRWSQSSSLTLRWLRLPENLGFAGAVATAWEQCQSPWVALLNDDTEAEPRWLEKLLEAARSAPGETEIASVASLMLSMRDPGTIDDAGDWLSWYGSAEKRGRGQPATLYSEDQDVFSASAGAALYRRSAVDEVGGFDPHFESYFEDIDLGLRLRLAGYRCRFAAQARVLHYGGASGLPRGRYVRLMTRNRLLTFSKSVPMTLLVLHSWRLLWGQVYFLIAYRHAWQSILGITDWILSLPRWLKQRRELRARRRLSRRQANSLLERTHSEPPLRRLVAHKLRSGRSRNPEPGEVGLDD